MSASDFIYLDHCGTTPLADCVNKVMQQYEANNFGNPSAFHHHSGERAATSLAAARQQISEILQAPFDGIVFTSGATEANNCILQGFAIKHQHRRARLIIGATEHRSIFETAHFCQKHLGAETVIAPVNARGIIDLQQFQEICARDSHRPTLVAIMHINNEIPTLAPLSEIAIICEKFDYHLHCDTVQSYVRQPLSLLDLRVHSLVISPHKFYGPKGIGILALRDGAKDAGITSLIHGGEQEFGLRAGTPNVALAVGAAAAMQYHEQRRQQLVQHMHACQQTFIDTLATENINWNYTVPTNTQCAGILSLWFPGVNAFDVLAALPEICINRGSSCSGGGEKYSHVHSALGLPIEVAANVLRVSFGDGATVAQCQSAAQKISAYIRERSRS